MSNSFKESRKKELLALWAISCHFSNNTFSVWVSVVKTSKFNIKKLCKINSAMLICLLFILLFSSLQLTFNASAFKSSSYSFSQTLFFFDKKLTISKIESKKLANVSFDNVKLVQVNGFARRTTDPERDYLVALARARYVSQLIWAINPEIQIQIESFGSRKLSPMCIESRNNCVLIQF